MCKETAVLNGLSDHYAEILGPKYAELYRQNIAGHRLAHDMTIEEYRAKPVILGFGSAPGPSVGDIKDISIPVSGASIPARMYYPPGFQQGQTRPCYVNFHGGGWVIGNVGDDDAFNRTVCLECSAIVIDVGYRLAPEHKYPIPVSDSWEAYQHIVKHPQQFSVDPAKVAVGGFSAGGHIAAVISQQARDQGVQPPCFQLLVIPVCDANALNSNLDVAEDCPYESWREHYKAPFLSFARMNWFYRYFLPSQPSKEVLQDPFLSPLQATSLANLPPALVVPAEVDVLRDEGIAYAHRLAKESGSFTQLWLAKKVPHPFPHQVNATEVAVQFRALAVQRLGEAFKGQLQGKKKEFLSNIQGMDR